MHYLYSFADVSPKNLRSAQCVGMLTMQSGLVTVGRIWSRSSQNLATALRTGFFQPSEQMNGTASSPLRFRQAEADHPLAKPEKIKKGPRIGNGKF